MPLNVKTRNLSLTPENEAFIIERVASGRLGSASKVVRAALRLLEDDERRRGASARPVGRQGQAAPSANPAQD